MSSHNDPVQPTPFDVVQPAPALTTTSPAAEAVANKGTPAWVLPALGGLVLLAVLVIFLLPAALEPREPAPAPTTAESSDAATPTQPAVTSGQSSPATTDVAPYSDAQAARSRKAAQEAAAELLDLQFALQERGVEQWAPVPFTQAATSATEGDALYKTGQFDAAGKRYQQGLATLQTVQDSMPQTLQRLLTEAQQALEQGDADTALAALKVAVLIEPDNDAVAALQQRAAVLPQLLPLLEKAAAAEAAGDLAGALALLQQATALDAQHPRAQSELQRVAAKVQAQDFNAAMSEGYAALDEGRFDSARKAFRAAAKLQPGSREAASALQEVATAETAQRLASLEQQGRRDEQQEQWQKAVEAYEQAQKVDRSVLFASEGLQRSRARAQLDQQLRTTIEQPQRLSDAAVAAAAVQLLDQAKAISLRGPVLEQQIQQLDKLVSQANSTVAVTLRSDKETEVLVYKVAKLGRFAERELTLRPGTYTAVGTRNGYRDVRQSFTISDDATPAPVTIICTERI